MKRFTAIFAAFSLAAFFTPAVSAQEVGYPLEYHEENGYIVIDGISVTVQDTFLLNIPDTIDGLPVEEIGESAFMESEFQTISLPDSLKRIDEYAFEGCRNLCNVNLPSGLKVIESEAFGSCSKLRSITLPDGLTEIGDGAFIRCGLTSVTIPDSVQTLGFLAFGISEISKVEMPAHIPEIHGQPFAMTPYMAARQAESPVWIENGVLIACYSEEETLTVPANVTKIGSFAYFGCRNLKHLIIPSGVSLSPYAFSGIESDDGEFHHSPLETVSLPDTLTEIPDYAFVCCDTLCSLSIPNSVKRIGDGAFIYCGINECTLPDTLTEIGQFAFQLSKLSDVIVPGSVKTISQGAFSYCKDLKTVTIAEGTETIEEGVFSNCDALEKVVIPESVKNFGIFVFEFDKHLLLYAVPDSVAEQYAKENRIPYYLTYGGDVNGDGLTNIADAVLLVRIVAEDSSVKIANGALSAADTDGDGSLTVADVIKLLREIAGIIRADLNQMIDPEALTYTSENGQVTITGLEKDSGCGVLVIPEKIKGMPVTAIADEAFVRNNLLWEVRIPDSVQTLGSDLFCCCENLTAVTLPEGIRSIAESVFWNCVNLKRVTIPESVTEIETNAFDTCKSVILVGKAGSYAEKYAKKYGLQFESS